jgi:hypothetical protein
MRWTPITSPRRWGSRNVIGQAKGFRMKRYKITAPMAFALLAESSQDTNQPPTSGPGRSARRRSARGSRRSWKRSSTTPLGTDKEFCWRCSRSAVSGGAKRAGVLQSAPGSAARSPPRGGVADARLRNRHRRRLQAARPSPRVTTPYASPDPSAVVELLVPTLLRPPGRPTARGLPGRWLRPTRPRHHMTTTVTTTVTPTTVKRADNHRGPALMPSVAESDMPTVESAGPSATKSDGARLPERVTVATRRRHNFARPATWSAPSARPGARLQPGTGIVLLPTDHLTDCDHAVNQGRGAGRKPRSRESSRRWACSGTR